jgi:hypothetical protein
MRFLKHIHSNKNLLDQIFLHIFLKQSLLKLYKFVLTFESIIFYWSYFIMTTQLVIIILKFSFPFYVII